jgi:MoaA/NifB/PqqE/SkfB family radical SAM enzyme
LKKAGLFSVSVSLDDWREEEHDRARGTRGAFREALRAIEVFEKTDGLDVGVSAVLSRKMIVRNEVEELLSFLGSLGVHEAWLSEAKPSVPGFWKSDLVITEEERRMMVTLQDRCNRDGGITVNYSGISRDASISGATPAIGWSMWIPSARSAPAYSSP